MEYILYISRFLYRIRWWLLIGTIIITFTAYRLGKRMIRQFGIRICLEKF